MALNAANIRQQYNDVNRINSPWAAVIRDYVVRWEDDVILPNQTLALREYARALVKDDHEEAIEFALQMYQWTSANRSLMPGATAAANIISEEYNDYMADL
jgi:hypothetical protein